MIGLGESITTSIGSDSCISINSNLSNSLIILMEDNDHHHHHHHQATTPSSTRSLRLHETTTKQSLLVTKSALSFHAHLSR